VAARTTAGEDGYDAAKGMVLERYKNQNLCNVCIAELKAEDESLQAAKKHAAAEKFRSKAGFVNSPE
jgi:hypothetical protein